MYVLLKAHLNKRCIKCMRGKVLYELVSWLFKHRCAHAIKIRIYYSCVQCMHVVCVCIVMMQHFITVFSTDSPDQGSPYLLSCFPHSARCHVSCDLRWDYYSRPEDQWFCQKDFIRWTISFGTFVGVHAIGTVSFVFACIVFFNPSG